MSFSPIATRLSVLGILFPLCLASSALASDPLNFFSRREPPSPLPSFIVQCDGKADQPSQAFLHEKAPDRPFFLHLWTPSCAPCQAEMKEIDALSERFEAAGWPIVTVAIDPSGAISVPAFAKRHRIQKISLCHAFSPLLQHKLSATGFPTTLTVNPEGHVTGRHAGTLDWSELLNALTVQKGSGGRI